MKTMFMKYYLFETNLCISLLQNLFKEEKDCKINFLINIFNSISLAFIFNFSRKGEKSCHNFPFTSFRMIYDRTKRKKIIINIPEYNKLWLVYPRKICGNNLPALYHAFFPCEEFLYYCKHKVFYTTDSLHC